MMQLDDVVSSTVTGPRVEEAMHRSIRWLDRCIAANKNPDRQNLFAIIQGGLNTELRKKCLDGKTSDSAANLITHILPYIPLMRTCGYLFIEFKFETCDLSFFCLSFSSVRLQM